MTARRDLDKLRREYVRVALLLRKLRELGAPASIIPPETPDLKPLTEGIREPELVQTLDRPPADRLEESAARTAKRKRTGKSYPAEIAVEVIRRVLDELPTRRLRDRLYDDIPDSTTYLIDHILDLTRSEPGAPYRRLSKKRRERWARAADELAEDGTVTPDELTKRLK